MRRRRVKRNRQHPCLRPCPCHFWAIFSALVEHSSSCVANWINSSSGSSGRSRSVLLCSLPQYTPLLASGFTSSSVTLSPRRRWSTVKQLSLDHNPSLKLHRRTISSRVYASHAKVDPRITSIAARLSNSQLELHCCKQLFHRRWTASVHVC